MLEAMAEAVALARGRFQQHLDLETRAAFMCFVERLGNPFETGLFLGVGRRAWVRDQVGQTKGLGTLHLDDESLQRFAPKVLVGRRQIDEIRIVTGGKLQSGLG